jgi:predicted RNase H-like HicB family nuclease
MNDLLKTQAEAISATPYPFQIRRTKTTTGETVYFAACQDLPGCLAQGQTPQEARQDLQAARFDYIYSLLEDGLPIPGTIGMENRSQAIPQLQDETGFAYSITPSYGALLPS